MIPGATTWFFPTIDLTENVGATATGCLCAIPTIQDRNRLTIDVHEQITGAIIDITQTYYCKINRDQDNAETMDHVCGILVLQHLVLITSITRQSNDIPCVNIVTTM